MRDRLADHSREILVPKILQVNECVKVDCIPRRQLAKNPHFTHRTLNERCAPFLQTSIEDRPSQKE